MPSPAAHRLTRQHQAELAALGLVVAQEVTRIARTVRPGDVDGWWARVVRDLVALVAAAFAGSRRLAGEYVREHAAVEGVDLAPVPARWDTSWAETVLRVTGPVEWKRHLAETGDERAAGEAMAETLAGSAQRLALAGSRDTVAETVRRRGRIVGWRRVPDADPCAFCAMLASRGAVFESRQTATRVGFAGRIRGTRLLGQSYHDNDQCVAEPLYEREDEPAYVDELYGQWLEVTAGHSGADAIRVWRRYWDERQRPEVVVEDGATEG